MPILETVGLIIAVTLLLLFLVKGNKAYTCPKCEKVFPWKQRHYLFTRLGTKRKVAPCPYCGIKLIYRKRPFVALPMFSLIILISGVLELTAGISDKSFDFVYTWFTVGALLLLLSLRLEVFSEKTSAEKVER